MRAIDGESLADALALNNDFATELSFQTPESFAGLVEDAFFAAWTPGREGFLIAFREDAPYAGENFRWFKARYPRFVYIDRVVVRPQARGGGHARALYRALIEAARADGRSLIVCEVNREPPNLASDAFHARLGFAEVGSAWIGDGAKQVRYLALGTESGA